MDEGSGAPARLGPPPPLCQDRSGRSPPSRQRLSRLGDTFCLEKEKKKKKRTDAKGGYEQPDHVILIQESPYDMYCDICHSTRYNILGLYL